MALFNIGLDEDSARTLSSRSIRGYAFQASKVGQWDIAKRTFNSLPRNVKNAVYAAQKSFANRYYDEIRRAIRTGGAGYGWPAVSEQYAEFKEKYSVFSRSDFYRFQLDYYNGVRIIDNPARYSVNVGIPHELLASQTRATDFRLSQKAYVLEHGSVDGKIKPRPLWGPAFQKVGGIKALESLIRWHTSRIKV